MGVTVVLATRGREELLARTLASLARCRLPPGFAGVVVVENGHRGGAARVVSEASPILRARHLFEPAGNKSRALNAALAQVGAGLVIFLDDDVRVAPELVAAYAEAAEGAGRGCFFGGPVEPEYEAAPPDWLTKFLPASARGLAPDPAQLRTKPFFLGFNWAAFCDELVRSGGFDEGLGPGTEVGVGDESNMQRRLAAAGATAVLVAEAVVHHWVPASRCSPEWALERAYRTGVYRGLVRPEVPGPIVAGYPLHLVKRVAGQWVRQYLPGANRGPRERFEARANYQRQRGMLRGAMLRRQRMAGAPASVTPAAAAVLARGDDR